MLEITSTPSRSSSASEVTRRDVLRLMGQTALLGMSLPVIKQLATPPLNAGAHAGQRPPNVLYMHSHDTGRLIAPYGYEVDTPNLSRFAAEGVRFSQAFSTSPTCSPSRAGLLTGMTPGCSGMWGLAHRGWQLNDYRQHLAHTLKRAGYATALAGVQHETSGDPQSCAATLGYDTLLPTPNGHAAQVGKAAASFLKNAPKRPFFLSVGFAETHVFNNSKRSPFNYPAGNPEHACIPSCLRAKDETRQDMADFQVALKALDAGMGEVLLALERYGLSGNTLVIITTDHGIPLPGMKANHTDGGLGVMLMLRGPGGFDGGRSLDALVSQIDVFPTIMETLGLATPSHVQGHSLLPLVRNEVSEINEAIYAEHVEHAVYEPQASVRSKRYKYIRRLDGNPELRARNTDETYTKALWLREGWDEHLLAAEQLYDLSQDPDERHNLATDPAHAEVLTDMRRMLLARMERYHNPLLARYRVTVAAPEREAPSVV